MSNGTERNIIEKQVDCKRVFDGLLLHIDHVTVELPNGQPAQRECARHIGASAIVPVDGDGNVWLVKQFRACVDQPLLEIPAGKLDYKGEDRLEAAKRELREETGLAARSWVHLTDIFTTPGFSDERISLFLARDLERGESHPDEDEFLNVEKLPLGEVAAAIMRGEIADAKTICAVMMAERLCR